MKRLAPQQVLIALADTPVVVVTGGVGTYKTTACVARLYKLAMSQPQSVWMVLMQTYQQLEMVFWRTWQTINPMSTYKRRGAAIELVNGSIVYLHYADHTQAATRIRGANLTGYFISQGESIRQASLLEELERRIGRAPGRPAILIEANGGNPRSPVNQRYIDHSSPIYYFGAGAADADAPSVLAEIARMRWGAKIERVIRIHETKTLTHIHIRTTPATSVYSRSTIDEWRRVLSPTQYRRMVEGESCADEGLVYPLYQVIASIPPVGDGQSIDAASSASLSVGAWLGVDPGTSAGNSNVGVVLLSQSSDGWYVVCDGGTWRYTDDLLQRLLALVDRHGMRSILQGIVVDWAGGAGTVLLDLARAAGIPCYRPSGLPAKWRPVIAGVQLVQQGFASGKLRVHAEAKEVLRDLQNYAWDRSGTAPDKAQYDSHILDALRYVWIRVGRGVD